MTIRKHYVDTKLGQVHLRRLNAQTDSRAPKLLCLHPAPSSGLYFQTALPLLNRDRDVIAPDYPGYGGSAALDAPVNIAEYAACMAEVVNALNIDEPVDVLGFHTGCLVAAEMALANPLSIRQLVLCDIPYFSGEQQDELRDKVTQPMPVSADLLSLSPAWQFNVAGRLDDVPLTRAFALFAEHLRAGRHDYFAFDAAFRYDCTGRFKRLGSATTCLATQSGLHAATIAAAQDIPGAQLIDVPEVKSAVFEAGAVAICKRITDVLDSA